MISLDKQFIFIHVPKTAGSSIQRVLQPFAQPPNRSQYRRLMSHLPVPEDPSKAWFRRHDKAWWLKMKMPRAMFDEFYKFAVVRNPFEWAISFYFFRKQVSKHPKHERTVAGGFGEFLRYLEWKNRVMGIQQCTWVTDLKGRIIVDDLIRFEAINERFPQILQRLGIDEETALPRQNETAHEDYQIYYSAKDRERASRLFARDLDMFGYEF